MLDYTLNCRGRLIRLDRPCVMGILNITPVSFITPEAILFDGIEVQATSPTTEVQPALTYPLLRDAQGAGK